eukprot:TRINITY_DN30703_c0_g1_i1.p1 TRINITY_DN30703_c0_g1~~TRINITY_DN30703_c0_g1_i1.p1  ORF type:complete len:234 (-),score=57.51 TRINITY_DN30703_c0_g1_i1:21-722(-)
MASRALQLSQHLLLPRDPDEFLAFYVFCHQQLCPEQVNFFLAVEEYKTLDDATRESKEEFLINKFVKTGARTPQLVNITNTLRNKIVSSSGSGDLDIFNEAQEHVAKMLEMEVYRNFVSTYKRPKKTLAGKKLEEQFRQTLDPDIVPFFLKYFMESSGDVTSHRSLFTSNQKNVSNLLGPKIIDKSSLIEEKDQKRPSSEAKPSPRERIQRRKTEKSKKVGGEQSPNLISFLP